MASGTDVLTPPAPSPGAPPERPQGRKMVRWFDPLVLLKAGIRSTISTTIGEQADRRLLDALATPKVEPSDFSVDEAGRPREELWFDFVADMGDGWDSTYAVAQTVSRPTLTLKDETGTAYETRRGEVLVFGGDEVYPEASVKEYEERTVRPWQAAMRGQGPTPHLFAIPGNHDWYDGLVSFMRLFCQGRQPAGWRTHQRRSYFAVKLPHGWWLLGTDMQLESDLDEPQVQYFQKLAKQMKEEDRIILCLAEPAWLLAQVRPPGERTHLDNNLVFLEQHVLGKKVSVFLTGTSTTTGGTPTRRGGRRSSREEAAPSCTRRTSRGRRRCCRRASPRARRFRRPRSPGSCAGATWASSGTTRASACSPESSTCCWRGCRWRTCARAAR